MFSPRINGCHKLKPIIHFCIMTNLQILQALYSISQYTDFTEAFFTFRISWHLMAHALTYFHLCPYGKYSLPCTNVHTTEKCSTALWANLLYQISSQWNNIYGNCRQKLIYFLMWSMASIMSIFMKLKLLWHHVGPCILNFTQIS